MKKEELYRNVIGWFSENMPMAASELHYRNAYELLVAVILSAQCTDKRVNMVTPALFDRFPDPLSMSRSDQEEIFSYIKSISYPNNKARHLLGMARMLQRDFAGRVPGDVEDLMKLPGVGRKTAHVIASVVFHQPKMAVDTHVFRVSARLGLVKDAKTPLETERQLVRYIPQDLIGTAHHWLILHGRYVCTARNPKCGECGLSAWCAYYSRAETDTAGGKKHKTGRMEKREPEKNAGSVRMDDGKGKEKSFQTVLETGRSKRKNTAKEGIKPKDE